MADKLHLTPVSEWGIFTEFHPMVIAGPCSAESEQQVLETAREIALAGIRVFRAGIWKPRTHPGCFEGVGTPGLKWLQRARELYGLKVCTEVAGEKHVRECIRHGIDLVWIGARTTANPFLVQELAEALQGTDLPVLVKNPINADLDLWIGALERLNRAGVQKIGVVHRGFSSLKHLPYRYTPGWRIAIELRTRYPDLPFFADPSHMAGDRKYVPELSQRALDLGLDGLMIESHCHPDQALSDAAQQLTPQALRSLLKEQLIVREADTEEADYRENIEQLRARIDILDENLLEILRSRMAVSEEIGRFKKEHNIAILQTRRWDALLDDMIRKGDAEGLNEPFLRSLFSAIHEESIRVQNDILSEKEESNN
ncbi:MAG: bifunctional 3-deoxy-7-phosphoheptulonate synthase/chorismate mutase type II [Bacteroidales bacterium]|nr:bifunctional 3-deoxy-7-phosphoheptulonate synthase/chorismate mutase type II [Bacteroidales bacterium]